MHLLDRASVSMPNCLTEYDYGNQDWDDLAADCKRIVRDALGRMQGTPGITTGSANECGVRCAYCEDAIRHGGHIEHFRRKNSKHYPELTFDWSNLFLACGSHTNCGHYKDRRGANAYDPSDLIKPDEDNPDEYLYFHSSGEVRVKSGLNNNAENRAVKTIEVFGLNNGRLKGARRKALSFYKETILADLQEIASWEPTDRAEYLAGEIESTRWDPYATTIKHFLKSNY